jgi:hypothetical protein
MFSQEDFAMRTRTDGTTVMDVVLPLTLLLLLVLSGVGCSGSSRAVEPAVQAAEQKPLTAEQVKEFATQDERVQSEEGGFSIRGH